MRISIAIMAHPSRAAAAEALAIETGGTVVWDQIGSEWHTGARALAAYDRAASHHIVLQDDALPVPGFVEHAAAAIAQMPEQLISFYLGTSRPISAQRHVDVATAAADEQGVAWLSYFRLLHGVAIALPTKDIEPLLAWADNPQLEMPYDERIGYWYYRRSGLGGSHYTWPSLVDHADDDSLVRHLDGQQRLMPRVARRVGVPATWETAVIAI